MPKWSCIPIFHCSQQCESIDRRHASIVSIPDEVWRYGRGLEELMLDANHIREISKQLSSLTSLRRLTLSDNEIRELPPGIGCLAHLAELDLSRNEITAIPSTLSNCRNLTTLDLSSNPLASLPASFCELGKLAVFALNDTALAELPGGFGGLTNLTNLELRENALTSLPPSFGQLVNLEKLDLGDNELSLIPPWFSGLRKLQELWLDHNLVGDAGPLPSLPSLQILDLSENHLPSFPPTTSPLTHLYLSNNNLQSLAIASPSLLTLKADSNDLTTVNLDCPLLEELTLKSNHLQSVDELFQPSLKLLNADYNDLESVGERIGVARKLSILSLRGCRVGELSGRIGDCVQLVVVDLIGNCLPHLPFPITSLPNLKAIWLSPNQSQPMPHFSTDYLLNEPILTCYLLPQMEDREKVDFNSEEELREPRIGTSVKFSEEEKPDGNSFIRHNTPHPRDLKAKFQRWFGGRSEIKGVEGEEGVQGVEGEEVDVEMGERHVGFSVSSSSTTSSTTSSPKPDLKLHRRDTPHHLKNKRIVMTEDVSELLRRATVKLDGCGMDAPKNEEATDGGTEPGDEAPGDEATLGDAASPTTPPVDVAEPVTATTPQPPLTVPQKRSLTLVLTRTKENNIFGLNIAGGLGSCPYRDDDNSIFISRIVPGGLAEGVGLRPGDRLLSINGTDFNGIEHLAAVDVIRKSGNRIIFQVEREEPPTNEHPTGSTHSEHTSSAKSGPAADENPTKGEYTLNPSHCGPTLNTTKSEYTLNPTHCGPTLNTTKSEDTLNPMTPSSETTLVIKIAQPFAPVPSTFPPPPTELGETKETITRSTLTETVLTRVTRNELKGSGRVVVLPLHPTPPLGLKLISTPTPLPPFPSRKAGAAYVHVAYVHPVGAAATAGFRLGDQILRVGGVGVGGNEEAVRRMTEHGVVDVEVFRGDHLALTPLPLPRPSPSTPLGIHIKGGTDNPSHPTDMEDSGIFISKILEGGVIAGCDGVKVGSRILLASTTPLLNVTHAEAVRALKSATSLTLCDGYNSESKESVVVPENLVAKAAELLGSTRKSPVASVKTAVVLGGRSVVEELPEGEGLRWEVQGGDLEESEKTRGGDLEDSIKARAYIHQSQPTIKPREHLNEPTIKPRRASNLNGPEQPQRVPPPIHPEPILSESVQLITKSDESEPPSMEPRAVESEEPRASDLNGSEPETRDYLKVSEVPSPKSEPSNSPALASQSEGGQGEEPTKDRPVPTPRGRGREDFLFSFAPQFHHVQTPEAAAQDYIPEDPSGLDFGAEETEPTAQNDRAVMEPTAPRFLDNRCVVEESPISPTAQTPPSPTAQDIAPTVHAPPQRATVAARAKFFQFEIEQLGRGVLEKAPTTPFPYLTPHELHLMREEEQLKISATPVRTAKAERRRGGGNENLSSAEARIVQAEKKAAWRQARLKSLEQDALQAQMVLNRMNEIIESPTSSCLGDQKQVETLEEKIISIQFEQP